MLRLDTCDEQLPAPTDGGGISVVGMATWLLQHPKLTRSVYGRVAIVCTQAVCKLESNNCTRFLCLNWSCDACVTPLGRENGCTYLEGRE